MSGTPLWATDPAPPRPRVRAVIAAATLACAAPMLVGLVLILLAIGVEFVLGPLSDTADTLGSLGTIGLYSPAFVWIGLVPGVLLHMIAHRLGFGGIGVGLVIVLAIGTMLSNWMGPFSFAFGLPVAAIYWLALRRMDPDCIRRRQVGIR